jgi:hypothetical protein
MSLGIRLGQNLRQNVTPTRQGTARLAEVRYPGRLRRNGRAPEEFAELI